MDIKYISLMNAMADIASKLESRCVERKKKAEAECNFGAGQQAILQRRKFEELAVWCREQVREENGE